MRAHSEAALVAVKFGDDATIPPPVPTNSQAMSGAGDKKKGMDWQQLAADQNRLKELELSVPTASSLVSNPPRSGITPHQQETFSRPGGTKPSSQAPTQSVVPPPPVQQQQEYDPVAVDPGPPNEHDLFQQQYMQMYGAPGTVIDDAMFVPGTGGGGALPGTVIDEAEFYQAGAVPPERPTYWGEAEVLPPQPRSPISENKPTELSEAGEVLPDGDKQEMMARLQAMLGQASESKQEY
jgi:hypothetical protein